MNNPENNDTGYMGANFAYRQPPPQQEQTRPDHARQGYGYGQMPPYGPYPPPGYGAAPGAIPPGYPWQGYMGQGYGGMPPYGQYSGPPPETGPGHGPAPNPEQTAARAGLASALGDIADKSGLGMFKDLFNLEDGEFWKGAMVGAAAVLLLTNDNLRNSLMGGAFKSAGTAKSDASGFNEEKSYEETIDDDQAANVTDTMKEHEENE